MAKKNRSFFENNSQQPAIIGSVSGLGLYTGIMLFAPAIFQNAAASIGNALSGLLGTSGSLFIGYLVPFALIVLASTFLTMGLYSMFAPEPPAQKSFKAGKEMLRNMFSQIIPGGRDAIDSIEDVAHIEMDIVKKFH